MRRRALSGDPDATGSHSSCEACAASLAKLNIYAHVATTFIGARKDCQEDCDYCAAHGGSFLEPKCHKCKTPGKMTYSPF